MPRTQHDRERQREQDQQDDESQRDAETASGLGSIHGRQGGGPLGLGLALMAREHVALIERNSACVGAQIPANEDVGRQGVELIALDLGDDADRNPGGLRDLRDRDLPQFALPFQIPAQ
jgi:hypothetical protein